jgi:hypothetical protein
LEFTGNLELKNNVFTGAMPSELGLLVQLRDQLDLSYNRLSGEIPSEIGLLVELSEFGVVVASLFARALSVVVVFSHSFISSVKLSIICRRIKTTS